MDQNEFIFGDEARDEGAFQYQLSLPLPSIEAPQPFQSVLKRDGREEPFDKHKIAEAIFRAAQSIGGQDRDLAESLANGVAIFLLKRMNGATPHVDHVHDAVERVLIHMSHARTALAYARYRDRRARIRRLREGDMRMLLSEIREARSAPGAANGHDVPALFVQTSTDMVTQWDRQRIIDALVRETGLEEAIAAVVAMEVEEQVKRGQITTLTSSLVRELVSAKLVEHGLDEYRERHRRLGVPVYDASRIIRGTSGETLGLDPEGTGQALARSVKKEFALSEVFSQEVAEAHIKGAFHLHHLHAVDELVQGSVSPGYLARQGIILPGGDVFEAPPQLAVQLLAQMTRLGDMLGAHFARGLRWERLSQDFAPFLQSLSADEIHRMAQMLVYEHAYRALADDALGENRFALRWSDSAQDSEHHAQSLALALIEVITLGGAGGAALPAPILEVTLDAPFWSAPGHESFLARLGEAAGAGRIVEFVFERKADVLLSGPVLHEITLNLPRIALESADASEFLKQVLQRFEGALRAHEEKAHFIEGLAERGKNGPLGLLWQMAPLAPGVDPAQGVALVHCAGLPEALVCLLGPKAARSEEAAALARDCMKRLSTACAEACNKTGIHVALGGMADRDACARFAQLDMERWPRSLADVFVVDDQDIAYSRETSLPLREGDATPFEMLRAKGAFHDHMESGCIAELRLPREEFETAALADLLRKAYFQTTLRGVRFFNDKR